MESGEHVLGAAGEVHLETCIKDLKTRFARVELQVGMCLVILRAQQLLSCAVFVVWNVACAVTDVHPHACMGVQVLQDE